jgi:hypothetical protein
MMSNNGPSENTRSRAASVPPTIPTTQLIGNQDRSIQPNPLTNNIGPANTFRPIHHPTPSTLGSLPQRVQLPFQNSNFEESQDPNILNAANVPLPDSLGSLSPIAPL